MGSPDHIGVTRDYIVDFNTPEYEGSWPRHVVSDRVAFAVLTTTVRSRRCAPAICVRRLRTLKLAIEKSSWLRVHG